MIDDGGVTADITRDDNNLIQVVCGAPNIQSNQTVVWLPPTSVVPKTYGTAEPFVLDSRQLRGYISNGMIASANELDLSDDHEGILVLSDDIKAGTKLTAVLSLDDQLLDIENKSLTHRPDCFGIIGFAREVAAIQGQNFTTPEWLDSKTPLSERMVADEVKLEVAIDNPEMSERYLEKQCKIV